MSMDQAVLRLWLKNYLTQIETNGNNPYQYTFSTGSSGLSYGALQNDVANNPTALATFKQILLQTMSETGLTSAQVTSIVTRAGDGNGESSFTGTELTAINTALENATSLVDQQDNATLNGVMGYINGAISAAASNPDGPGGLSLSNPDLTFIGELAEWSNRTFPPGLGATNDFLSGGDSPYNGETWDGTRAGYDTNYLSQTAQFTTNGEDFSDWTSRVNAATSDAVSSMLDQGYYITQSDDIGSTDLDTANNILTSFSLSVVDGAELVRLNGGTFGDFGLDGLVYIPTGSEVINTTPNNLSGITTGGGEMYVYDSANSTAYAVGPGLSGTEVGALYVLDNNGKATVFAPGTWKDIADTSDDSGTNVDLQDQNGDTIGSLSIDKATGHATLTAGSGSPGSETFSGTGTVFVIRTPDGGDTVGQLGGGAWHVNTDGTISSAVNPFPDGGTRSLGPFTALLKNQFSHSRTDPILFDLSSGGTGVQLTSLASSSAYFDLKDTGFAIHTGWVSSTTGILVNSSNPTSASNLIGATAANGFTALQSLDTNHNGVINSSDTGFSSLYIWEDTNSNALDVPGDRRREVREGGLLDRLGIFSDLTRGTVNCGCA